METLRGMQHVVVGPAGALVVLVILARAVELRQLRIDFVLKV